MTPQVLYYPDEVKKMIAQNRVLLLAGDERLLAQLPPGRWIGGTSAYFMSTEGGISDHDRIFVSDLTEHAETADVRRLSLQSVRNIGKRYPENGFAVLIIPGMSEMHAVFAKDVQDYEDVFNVPLVGWISGVALSELGQSKPKVFAGSGEALDSHAAAMFVTLPENKIAQIDTVNPFKQGKGDVLEFDREDFTVEGNCRINGELTNFVQYLRDNKVDKRHPLVADYNGVMVNVAIQAIDEVADKVTFYAPVFRNTLYRFAEPFDDYAEPFNKAFIATYEDNVVFSCNCILNYIYSNLEGKKTSFFVGPITFGEIAYILLNQTLVYLSIEKID